MQGEENYLRGALSRKESHRRWVKNNPEKVKARRRRYQMSGGHARSQKRWRSNPENYAKHVIGVMNRRAMKALAEGNFTQAEWEFLKVSNRYMCLCCGFKEPEIKLTVDHIVPLSKGGSNFIENIQPLCGHCNFRKGVEIIDYRD